MKLKKAKKSKNSTQFYNDLKESLEEVLAHQQGKITLRSVSIEIPKPPATYKPRDIKRIRDMYAYSQGLFAMYLNVSIKTVQSWESGQRHPSPIALRLLECLDKNISPLQLG